MNFSQAARILGIEEKYSPEELKKAYKKRAFETHPDRGGDPAEFLTVQAAYDILRQNFQEKGTYEEMSGVLHERINGVERAFKILFQEADRYINDSYEQMIMRVINSLNSYSSAAELKNRYQNDLTFHWNSFVNGTTGFIESRVSKIADEHDEWLKEYLKPVIERARYENPPRWYQNKKASYLLISFSIFSGIVSLYNGTFFYLIVPIIILIVLAIWLPQAYQNLFKWKRVFKSIDLSHMTNITRFRPTNEIGTTTEEMANSGGTIGAGLGLLVGGPVGIIVGGLIGGIIGSLFGKSLSEIKQEILDSFVENANQKLVVMLSALENKLNGMQREMINLMKKNFNENVSSAIKLLANPEYSRK